MKPPFLLITYRFRLHLNVIWDTVHAHTLSIGTRLGHLHRARLLDLLVLADLGNKLRNEAILRQRVD